ncbi:helix-turn-helix transcriptional regulator [Candidatus Woesearchaeota archaeon]|nr:helix-turn-helix transcriptional regulator [Candidatus Woesearchaeota archaeon]
MKGESFLLVSLKEDKAKKLAQVIANDSCKKILEHLTQRDATETELAKKLDIPLSTVHYNLKQLVDSGLVISDEYHYSSKGKTINHYKLASKYIIIAPKSTFGLKERLKGILPVLGIGLVATAFIKYYTTIQESFSIDEAAPMMARSADFAQEAYMMQPAADYTWLWFLVGFLLSLALYLALQTFFSRRE